MIEGKEKTAGSIVHSAQGLGAQCGTERMQYHVEISDQINRLEVLVDMLDGLISEISGNDCCEPAKNPVVSPVETLGDVLTTGAARISEKHESIARRIDEVRALLF